MTKKMLIAALRYQNQREVEMLQESMHRQVRKSVEVQKMPSVRVRPTLRVEMKHRVMNCKLSTAGKPASKAKRGEFNLEQLNESVLKSLRDSKRSGLGGQNR